MLSDTNFTMRTLLAIACLVSLSCTTNYRAEIKISLANLPEITGETYKITPFLNTAISLQKVGKETAIKILKAALAVENQDQKIIVLCRMLFVPRQNQQFRNPMLGLPLHLGMTKMENWPLTPIEIVDGVPFLIVRGYLLAGHAESGAQYLDYCLENCDWNNYQYQEKSLSQKEQALEKFFADPKWQGIVPKVFLTTQLT